MKKTIFEIILAALVVLVPTTLIFERLSSVQSFWDAQSLWSAGLMICWTIVALGYYHQGWLLSTGKNPNGVSQILPIAVFFVQCILFVKGIYYHDWSLIYGALIVNSGVAYSLYHLAKAGRLFKS